MLELLAPFWWLALPALAAPVLIHLWSRREPRPIRVGSVRFLEETIRTHARSLHLSDVVLLLVRLLVLAALIFLLTRPQWKSETASASPEPLRWALVHPDATALRAVLRAVDSLNAAGFDPRRLEPGFLPYTGDDDAPVKGNSAGIWSLLREADAALPPGSEIAVVAPTRPAAFHGIRPTLDATVTWYATPDASRNHWVETARRVSGDSLFVVVGVSDSLRTFFRKTVTALPETTTIVSEDQLPSIEVDLEAGVARLIDPDVRAEDDRRAIAPEAAPLQVVVYHDAGRREDARYVRAGVEAAAAFARLPVAVERLTVEEAGGAPTAASLVFWLSDGAIPTSLLEEDGEVQRTLVRGAQAGEVQRVDTRVTLPGASPALLRRVRATRAGVPVWTDGYGSPLLVEERAGAVREFTFFSRFHPAWTDLVLDESWPAWLLDLLRAQIGEPAPSEVLPAFDLRTVSVAQALPRRGAAHSETGEALVFRPWHVPLWGLVVVLLALERWMALRRSS